MQPENLCSSSFFLFHQLFSKYFSWYFSWQCFFATVTITRCIAVQLVLHLVLQVADHVHLHVLQLLGQGHLLLDCLHQLRTHLNIRSTLSRLYKTLLNLIYYWYCWNHSLLIWIQNTTYLHHLYPVLGQLNLSSILGLYSFISEKSISLSVRKMTSS